jgi:thiol-disulfide isomerase/thioredoxin
MVYVSLFLVWILATAGLFFFIQTRLASFASREDASPMYGVFSKIFTAGWFTLIVLVIFFGFFWAFRGFPPGSRLVVGELPTSNDLKANQATFLFFYTQWCPYSQDAIPKVKSLSELVGGFTYGGNVVTVNPINCEAEEKLCNRYGVTAYPTYKLITASKVYEYSGPPRTSTYEEFIVTALGAKEPLKIPE